MVSSAILARQGGDAPPLPGTSLRELGREHGIAIGTAVRADILEGLRSNRAYRQLVAQQFSSLTPENEMKWGFVEPKRGRPQVKGADAVVNFAREQGLAVRGHTLVWHAQMPPWAPGLGRDDLAAATDAFIRRMVGRYRGRVAAWDVVNEVVADSGRLRRSPYLRRLGPGYIAAAFEIAHEVDPRAKLFINEIGADGINAKSDRLYELVRELKGRGVPIDGVGFQVHANLKGVPPSFRDNMGRFAALGLEVALTEVDVGIELPASQDDLRRQAEVYAGIVRDCLRVSACKSLTSWGFTDGRSWISETQPGMGAATLLDEALMPKPAFLAVQRALGG